MISFSGETQNMLAILQKFCILVLNDDLMISELRKKNLTK